MLEMDNTGTSKEMVMHHTMIVEYCRLHDIVLSGKASHKVYERIQKLESDMYHKWKSLQIIAEKVRHYRETMEAVQNKA